MPRGKFIVFDGIDGIGKGSNAKRLVRALYERDKTMNVLLTREPFIAGYDGLRAALKSIKDPYEHAREFAKLFVEDRRKHAEVISFLLERGVHVICDRYKYSTLVYQSEQGIPFDELEAMHTGLPVPDITIILDVPFETAIARMQIDTTRGHVEVFEKPEFLKKIQQRFRDLPAQLPKERIVLIDAQPGIEEVFAKVYAEVEKVFN